MVIRNVILESGSGASSGSGDFSDGGEAGGAARSLGNTDAQLISILTNNLARLTILSDGKVGIGTETPQEIFQARPGTDENFIVQSSILLPDGVAFSSVNDANTANKGFEVRGSTIQLTTIGTNPINFSINGSATPSMVIGSDGNITTTGTLTTKIANITQAATDTLTTAEVSGTIVSNYGQSAENTQTLPAAAEGLNFIGQVGTAGAGALHFKAGATDKIYFDGTALDDADKVSCATPAVGDYITFWTFQTGASAYDWIAVSGNGTWTDGGA